MIDFIWFISIYITVILYCVRIIIIFIYLLNFSEYFNIILKKKVFFYVHFHFLSFTQCSLYCYIIIPFLKINHLKFYAIWLISFKNLQN